MGKIKKNKLIGFMNSLAAEKGYEQFTIDTESSRSSQDESFRLQFAALDKNFIMSNIDNMIRTQIYHDLKAEEIADRDFGFWKTADRSGTEIIHENTVEGSERTGDPATDFGLISPEPETEIQVVEYTDNFAVDVKGNRSLQNYATIDGFAGWVDKRYSSALKALDKELHTARLEDIKGYLGFKEILIDPTDLDQEQMATAMEMTIAENVTTLGADYTNDNSLGFDNLIKPEEIGLILSVKSFVNRKVAYLRKQVNMDDEKDWGLGHITTKILTEDQEAILLPKDKFIWGAEYGSIDTPLGFALIEKLTTDYVFHGSVFMESVAAVRITFGTPETFAAKLAERKERSLKFIEKKLAAIKHLLKKGKMELKDITIARKQLFDLRDAIQKADLSKVVEKVKVVKFNPKDLQKRIKMDMGDFEKYISKQDKLLEKLAKTVKPTQTTKKQTKEVNKALEEEKNL